MLSAFSSKVNFFSDGVSPNIRNRKRLKKFIEAIFTHEGASLQSINYIFCNDKKLRQISKDFLNHDYFTDIVTFNFSKKKEAIASEVYISIDRIKENAKDFAVNYKSELHRVIFHGALHLCGYRDKSKTHKQIMRKREDYYLLKYFP